MKKFVLSAIVAMVAATAPTTAHAAPLYDYRGGCSFATLNDTTPGGQLGGQNVWNGAVVVAVRAVEFDNTPADQVPATPSPTTSISVNCELVINGGAPTVVLSASGTGAAANADQIQFTAASGSVVQLCDNVTVGGEHVRNCGTSTETPIVPQPVQDALLLLDPAICTALIAAAPVVDSTVPNTVAYIEPVTGDTYLLGTTPNDLFFDCPPYVP